MPAKILVVDDDVAIRRLLRNTLLRADYAVVEAESGKAALRQAAAEQPSAILLDLGLPDRDGLSVIPLLRAQSEAVILVVSARDAVDEKVTALDLGADDFVTKPFDTDELLARLRVALRHQGLSGTTPKIIRRGDLTIDLDRRMIRRGSEEVHLTRKEHDVLAVLARHIGRVVTHERLLTACWGADEDPRIEYLRIVIRNLRQKLEPAGPVGSVIANELGVGYRLRGDS
ncbi:two-component system, OmpR family, KDP operon response regulator KdpE [Sphingomonas guangdongensis]|uniref:Two-component system, OmpR family, KDP operon response regulator KdpE n=1 Tax=Sphingomonas guangdongensis TaxID=1141890 RepID=A0A285Q9U7_9SPHN|nr:response regulator transcription factor [Sphingomonas guangdongensis]SOB78715.1 two-component system, OmpR family, KDP operon response regulator KdpE [Sphingomonas guangdongensis]